MPNELIDARPGTGGWSAPVQRESALALDQRYASHGGHIDRPFLHRILSMLPGLERFMEEPLSDGYVPLIGAIFSIGGGKLVIVFPHCVSGPPDRAVTVHTSGNVDDQVLDVFVRDLIDAIPEKRPARALPRYSFRRSDPLPKQPVPVSDLVGVPWSWYR